MITAAISADIDRFITDASAAWDMPGQVLALVEVAARDTANRIGQALIQHALQVPADRHRPGPTVCGQGHQARLAGTRPRIIRTALGQIVLERPWYHCAACHAGFAPTEAHYGVSVAGTSTGYDKILSLAGAEQSYRASAHLITELTGIALAPATAVARTTGRVGHAAKQHAQAETAAITAGRLIPLATEPVPDLCYVMIDGTGAPMVPAETEGRQGKYPDGRARTREVKIGCLFTQAHAIPDGEPVRIEGSASYIATFDDATNFAQQLKAEHTRRGFDHIRQPIMIGDGAKWIWTIAERLFPEATHIVDYWHAREHLHDLIKIFDHILTDPEAFTKQLIDHLDHGDIDAIIHQIDTLDLDHYQGNIGERTRSALGYFTTNTHRMQYQHYRANGWFIGSGPVEAACKTIVAQRAKQAGMRWTITGLDPILTLRTLTRSGRDHLICNNTESQTTQTQAA